MPGQTHYNGGFLRKDQHSYASTDTPQSTNECEIQGSSNLIFSDRRECPTVNNNTILSNNMPGRTHCNGDFLRSDQHSHASTDAPLSANESQTSSRLISSNRRECPTVNNNTTFSNDMPGRTHCNGDFLRRDQHSHASTDVPQSMNGSQTSSRLISSDRCKFPSTVNNGTTLSNVSGQNHSNQDFNLRRDQRSHSSFSQAKPVPAHLSIVNGSGNPEAQYSKKSSHLKGNSFPSGTECPFLPHTLPSQLKVPRPDPPLEWKALDSYYLNRMSSSNIDTNMNQLPQQLPKSPVRPTPVPSFDNKSSDNKHLPAKNQSPMRNTANNSAGSDQYAEDVAHDRMQALRNYTCYKTSKYQSRICEWKYRPEGCWGWILDRIDPSNPSAPVSRLKYITVSDEDDEKSNKNSSTFSNVPHRQPLSATVNGWDTRSNKGKNGNGSNNSFSSGTVNQHMKSLSSKGPVHLKQAGHSAAVNSRNIESKKREQSTSKDSQPGDALNHYCSSVMKRPSPSSVSNLIKKPICDKKNSAIDDTTMDFFSSKKDRKPIYSGKKSAQDIQSLKATCIDSLKKDVLDVKVDGQQSMEKLLPILEQCEPSKLKKIEDQNKNLHKFTDIIWQKFCRRDFGDKVTNEGLPWRYTYWKAYDHQQKKLKNIKASIANGMAKAQPERQTKLLEVASRNPEKRHKKIKTEEPVKPEVNSNGSFHCKSSGSDSSSSPKLNAQKTLKDSEPAKKKRQTNLVEVDSHNPEIRHKKMKTEVSVKPQVNGNGSSFDCKSSGSDSSNSPKLSAQKSVKDSKPAKKTVGPLMSKAKKMARRR